MTEAGAVNLGLVAIAAVILLYLIAALMFPERF